MHCRYLAFAAGRQHKTEMTGGQCWSRPELSVFLAIWWPLKCQITTRRARIMIAIIWLIAGTVTLPWAIFFELVKYDENSDIMFCVEQWPEYFNGHLYFLFGNLLFCYILPMILITLCYVLIWVKVCHRHIPSDSKDAQMERMQQKSKVKVVKMLVVVVILFVLSWMPLYIIVAMYKFGRNRSEWEDEMLNALLPIAQWLGAANSCINPVLYAFFNNKFRRGFAAIIKSKKCCGTLRYYETVVRANSTSTSLRKSSYYVTNNNNNSSRRQLSLDTNVSYISNNSGV
ncbi:unnamed protein product [Nezara viridula]|uniref:G-protein coupled receptors family 1 profile domain-containing protein n=1 Tax=Nezara viridula TaxID=85310 RepID=A0A9P0HE71_NEZVI|nr:unnamed protein product [Nezara viridula]